VLSWIPILMIVSVVLGKNWQMLYTEVERNNYLSWAENISPQMNVDINRSPSFGYFRDKLRHLSQEESR